MKKVILCGDGMGDYPVESLGNKTPLQAALKITNCDPGDILPRYSE